MSALEDGIAVTGVGVATPIGLGTRCFTEALQSGDTNFSTKIFERNDSTYHYPIAGMDDFNLDHGIDSLGLDLELSTKAKRLRHISTSTAQGLYCALEAWKDANLPSSINANRVAIVSAGSNTQQSSLEELKARYEKKLRFLNPNSGFNFYDTDIVGVISELLDIKGEGFSVGAASASGNMALIQSSRMIRSNEYDVIIVVAPLMDISVYEFQGFTALGAMAQLGEGIDPQSICRPFDKNHCGFVYGQSSGCVVLESSDHATARGQSSYGAIIGYGTSMDANRNPNPCERGEELAMQAAIKSAQIRVGDIDYVNTHGTASVIGDETEISAMLALGLEGVYANSTKSLIGHGLSAAGLVETIAVLLQMKNRFFHPSHNLIDPISDKIKWVVENSLSNRDINYAVNNSFGFGGINSSIVLKNM